MLIWYQKIVGIHHLLYYNCFIKIILWAPTVPTVFSNLHDNFLHFLHDRCAIFWLETQFKSIYHWVYSYFLYTVLVHSDDINRMNDFLNKTFCIFFCCFRQSLPKDFSQAPVQSFHVLGPLLAFLSSHKSWEMTAT